MTPRKIGVVSCVAAAVGVLMLAIGVAVDTARAYFAYLTAWTFGATVCVGALLLLMVGHASKGSWTVVTRRLNEAVVDALPLYAMLFLPLCFGLGLVYPWAAHGNASPALRASIEHKRTWLSPPFFIARTVVYFAVFVSVGTLLRAWSKTNDARPTLVLVRRMRRLSGGALPLVGLTLTWASFDWTMSLEPDWHSTIFGLYYFAGAFVGAIALVSVMLNVARLNRELELCITPDHAQAVGRLLFAMIVFWAYMAFSQLLIYWLGDIPDEVSYYALRTTGSWTAVTYLLVFGMFIGPFFALLNRRWKRRAEYLAAVGTWVFFMHYVDVYWMVMPVHDVSGARPHWLDLAAVLFVGGLSCAWIARRYFSAAPLPVAPDLEEGLGYEAAV